MSRFMFELGRRCARHPWRVLTAWILAGVGVLGLQGALGGTSSDDYRVPDVESQTANDVLAARFPAQAGWSGRIVFHVDSGRLDDPAPRAAIDAALRRARQGADVATVSEPFDPHQSTVSDDGRTAYATINYRQNAPKPAYVTDARAAADEARNRGVQTELSGEIGHTDELEGGEAIGLIAAVIVLLVGFGSIVATGIPIGTAIVGLVVGLGGIGLLAGATDVSSSAPILASMIGLGVGIDYALFVVTRFRQHLGEGMPVSDAAGHANATAGVSVLFAGTTVVVAICGLVMAGIPTIATMGFAAAIVVLISMLVAVTLLPALLGLAGTRIDRWSIHRRRSRRGTRGAADTLAGRWANHVGRRPRRYALGALAVLLALAAPITAMRIGFADDSNRPNTATEHRAFELLADAFGPGFNGPFLIVAELPGTGRDDALATLTEIVSTTPGIAAVQPPEVNPTGDTAVIVAQPTTGPQDPATAQTLRRLRDDVLPAVTSDTRAAVYVTGHAAILEDLSDKLASRLPVFIAAVVALSVLLLFVLFRSVLVPLKAALVNLLSIGAAYGVIVAIFQWGWGTSLFGVHATVPIDPFVPMIMFAILFGLSMDYEVFLLSRVREEYQQHGNNHRSVVDGLAGTARVITSAALIMISVFLAFAAASDVTIKMFGVGLATAVLIDATVVRMLLVPSTMALLGRANWWLPAPLDRILPHINLDTTHTHGDTRTATGATTTHSTAEPATLSPGNYR
jgi:putative drug exporter of the RND superfamily